MFRYLDRCPPILNSDSLRSVCEGLKISSSIITLQLRKIDIFSFSFVDHVWVFSLHYNHSGHNNIDEEGAILLSDAISDLKFLSTLDLGQSDSTYNDSFLPHIFISNAFILFDKFYWESIMDYFACWKWSLIVMYRL